LSVGAVSGQYGPAGVDQVGLLTEDRSRSIQVSWRVTELEVSCSSRWCLPAHRWCRRGRSTGPITPRLDIDVDLDGGKVYWTEFNSRNLRRANLDGSDDELLLDTGGPASGLALDLVHGKIYWGQRGGASASIWRADLDGTDAEFIWIGGTYPDGVAVDPAGGKVYWSDRFTGLVRRANLDGSDVEVLFEASRPLNLALDTGRGKLYWTEWIEDTILRSNLDGSSLEIVFEGGPGQGLALDLVHDRLYFDDGGTQFKRADLDGGNVETILDGLSGPTIRRIALAIGGVCGDGTVDPFEECDDGNNIDGDGCNAECLLPKCGDGFLDEGEECDDFNLLNCDGCTDACTIESGPICGDGILLPDCGEECDDGNNVDGDGCQGNCLLPFCGDGIIDGGEDCDDGGVTATCDDDCTFAECGDGNVNEAAGEQCDDGNNMNGDGCEADCTLVQIPALSSRGLTVAVLLLLMTTTAILLWRRRE